MTYRQIIGLSSVTLCLCISMAACDKATLTEVMKVGSQVAAAQPERVNEFGTLAGGI
jgi:hypothetical protein